MPSKHKGHTTIAFRPSSSWQYVLIEERAKLSGLYKKDFIIRSCIYSNICVVGKKETVQRIMDCNTGNADDNEGNRPSITDRRSFVI